MKCGVYGFRNMVDGKWYIGQSVNIEKRQKTHLLLLGSGRHSNLHFQNAFNKYGKSNFEFRILEEVLEAMLDVRECVWITYYQSAERNFGYNNDSGGKLNKRHSGETIRKMSASQRKRPPISDETRKKYSKAQKGKRLSEKHKRKISEAGKGRVHSLESRKKISEAQKGKSLSAEHCRALSVAHKGHVSGMKGRHHSVEIKRKISESLRGNKNAMGQILKENNGIIFHT